LIAQAQALRIGVFAVGALLLLVAAVAAVFGARLLADSERVVMHFNGSVRGLDLGAPVVLRGVRVGSVRAIRLERGATGLEVPVEAELALPPLGPGGLKGLLAQGLSAQLATQSLLTGQLYVELDLRPLPGRLPATPAASGLTTIPTVAQRFESLQAQLETLDLSRIAQDLAAVLASAQKAADELARSAAVLAATAAPDGAAAQRLERTAVEVARAARSLRELSTLLQEQPEALLRGRRNDTGGPP
jgi:paraquat-inducible protein B